MTDRATLEAALAELASQSLPSPDQAPRPILRLNDERRGRLIESFRQGSQARSIARMRSACDAGYRFEWQAESGVLQRELHIAACYSNWHIVDFLLEEASRQGWSLEKEGECSSASPPRGALVHKDINALWRSLSVRDDPSGIPRLLALGADIDHAFEPLFTASTPHCARHLLQHHSQAAHAHLVQQLERVRKSTTAKCPWLEVAFVLGEPLAQEMMARELKLEVSRSTTEVTRHFPSQVQALWQEAIENGDVAKMRRLLGFGMGPSSFTFAGVPLPLLLLEKEHVEAFSWMVQSPQVRALLSQHCAKDPQKWWDLCPPTRSGVALLEALRGAGIDLLSKDVEGNTYAHYHMKKRRFKRQGIDWVLRHCPQMMLELNSQGLSPLALCSPYGDGAKMRADIQERLMKKSLCTVPAAPKVARARM